MKHRTDRARVRDFWCAIAVIGRVFPPRMAWPRNGQQRVDPAGSVDPKGEPNGWRGRARPDFRRLRCLSVTRLPCLHRSRCREERRPTFDNAPYCRSAIPGSRCRLRRASRAHPNATSTSNDLPDCRDDARAQRRHDRNACPFRDAPGDRCPRQKNSRVSRARGKVGSVCIKPRSSARPLHHRFSPVRRSALCSARSSARRHPAALLEPPPCGPT